MAEKKLLPNSDGTTPEIQSYVKSVKKQVNKELGLPFDKMKKVKVAFDVDGTLRCNCTATCRDPNEPIVELFNILNKYFKNIELYVWSGGGATYARDFARLFKLSVGDARCLSKVGAPQMDVAIDDIQDTAIGIINLIVKMK